MSEKNFTITRRKDHRLVHTASGEDGKPVETPVQAGSCFPWTMPDRYVFLKDDKHKEVVLLDDLSPLTDDERKLVLEEISQKNFVPKIEKISSIRRELDLFHWIVHTAAGDRSFMTNRHEAPRSLTGGRVLIRDISGDLYLVEDYKKLDPKSLKMLWMYLD
jgi:hypothetical protein